MADPSNILPPPPVRQKLIDENGFLSPIWWIWFTQLFNRTGTGFAATNSDLEILNAYSDYLHPEAAKSSNDNANTVLVNYEIQSPNITKAINNNLKLNYLQAQDNTAWDKKTQDLAKLGFYPDAVNNGNVRGPDTLITDGNLAVWDAGNRKIKDGGVPSGSVVTSVSGTANRITSTGGTTPIIDIAATYVGQSSITTLGTIATGIWNAGAVTSSGAVQGTTLVSTIATGTAPLTVASTTLVANLYAARAVLADTSTIVDAAGDTTTFILLSGSATGNLPILSDTGLIYNATTKNLATTTFTGSLAGNATSSTTATNTTITDDTTTNATMYPTWVTANTGNLPQKVSSTKFTMNPSTGKFSATSLGGALTDAAQTAITSVGTLTGGATGAGFTVALGTSTITGILGSANGGTANGFTKFSGPSASEKTFTLPNASDTIACLGQAQTFSQQQIIKTNTTQPLIVDNSTAASTTALIVYRANSSAVCGYIGAYTGGPFIVLSSVGTTQLSMDTSGNLIPGADNTYALGSSTLTWANFWSKKSILSSGTDDGVNVLQVTGGSTLQGSLTVKTRSVTAAGAITVGATDYYIGANKTVGAATVVNLPATPATGRQLVIKDEKGDAATNNITLTPNAGNIDNAATYVMNANKQSATIIYNGTQWTVN